MIECSINKRIYHFSKPYIALLNGITMGGGVGISVHGSYRIATDKLVFAMPETNIGFYPDVGTTYFLPRLPYNVGYYLGLTGARLSYEDCFALGIVQEVVAAESLPLVIDLLRDAEITHKDQIPALLQPLALTPKSSPLLTYQNEIEYCFGKPTVEEIIEALESEETEWHQQTAASLKTKSPTSLKVTLQALQQASQLNFDTAIQMEYRITCHFVEGHDFFEGIRAVVIDKDQAPHWKPPTLESVTAQTVETYFKALTEELT